MVARIVLVLFALSAVLTAANAADLKVLTTGSWRSFPLFSKTANKP